VQTTRSKKPVPVRIRASDSLAVGKNRTGRGAVLKNIARGPERSSLFYWLYDLHDQIVQAAVGRRIRWEPIQAQAIELGLTDGANKPPTAERVRQTWYFVRKEVVKQRALRVAGGNRLSLTAKAKRAPATWLPPALAQPSAPPPLGGVHQGVQSAALPSAQPGSLPSAAASQDSSRPAPGSIEAARQKANLRSGLKANGDPLHKR